MRGQSKQSQASGRSAAVILLAFQCVAFLCAVGAWQDAMADGRRQRAIPEAPRQPSRDQWDDRNSNRNDSGSDNKSSYRGDNGSSGRADKRDESDRQSDKSDSDRRDSPGQATGNGDKSKSDKKGGNTAEKADAAELEPPATVSEMFKRLFKPAQPSAEREPTSERDGDSKGIRRSDPDKSGSDGKTADTVKPTAGNKKLETAAKPPEKSAKAVAAARGRIEPINDPPAMPLGRPEFLVMKLPAGAAQKLEKLGFKSTGTATLPRAGLSFQRFLVPPGVTVDEAHDMMTAALPDAEFDLNKKYRIFKPANAPGDLKFEEARPPRPMPTSCGTDRCFAPEVTDWKAEHTACAAGVKIGLIDTGFDETHPALKDVGKMIVHRRVGKGVVAPNWHGTGVLALLAGKGTTATPGLVPQAKFHVADIFYSDIDGQPASDTATLVEAIDWLAGRGVHIINMSLAGPPDPVLEAVIARIAKTGVIFVAAAGNDGPHAQPLYPAGYAPVIAVTAVSSSLQNYRHAVRGKHIDLAAPGVDIWTAMPGNRAAYHSGTSFAAPYVTAIIASMHAALPGTSKASVLSHVRVRDLGDPGRDPIFGQGLAMAPKGCAAPIIAVSQKPQTTSSPAATPAAWAPEVVPPKASGLTTTPGSGTFQPSGDR